MSRWLFDDEGTSYAARMARYHELMAPVHAAHTARLHEKWANGAPTCSAEEFRAHANLAAVEFDLAEREVERAVFPRDQRGYLR